MEFTDQMDRKIHIDEFPKKIISLVPSQTELLVDLGLEDKVVGLTKFCVHPKGVKKGKTIIGGTKHFHFDRIEALEPDLIIGNKEENYQEGIMRLADKYPVWVSDIRDLDDAMEMIQSIGAITDSKEKAQQLAASIQKGLSRTWEKRGTAIYLIWQNPIMAAGKSTFIDQMLNKAGFENLVKKERYPEVREEEIRQLRPENILLSSEPFPFQEKHLPIYQEKFPWAKVQVVDGEIFSWFGSRLRYAPGYFDGI